MPSGSVTGPLPSGFAGGLGFFYSSCAGLRGSSCFGAAGLGFYGTGTDFSSSSSTPRNGLIKVSMTIFWVGTSSYSLPLRGWLMANTNVQVESLPNTISFLCSHFALNSGSLNFFSSMIDLKIPNVDFLISKSSSFLSMVLNRASSMVQDCVLF